jgi:hypothetical protein
MRFRLVWLGVVVAVLVAACGGSSTPAKTTKKQSSQRASVTQKKTAASTGTSSNPAAASTTTTSAAAATTGSTPAASSQPTFASATNCTQLAGLGEQYAKAMSAATSGGKFDLGAAVTAYRNLANAAPSAIRPDLQVLAGAFASYANALSKSGYKFGTVPSASQVTAVEQAVKTFDTAKMSAALKHLKAWGTANCR